MMREKDISIKFQSTLPVRGATNFKYGKRHLQDISIHAPRAGSDTGGLGMCIRIGDFNPRSPCGERQQWHERFSWERYFNPRSPCGERLPGETNL